MKKISTLLKPTVIEALKEKKFRESGILGNAQRLIAYAIETAATGRIPRAPCRILPGREDEYLFPTLRGLKDLQGIFNCSNRISSTIDRRHLDMGAVVTISFYPFYPKDKKRKPLLMLEGGIDTFGIRYLRKSQ